MFVAAAELEEAISHLNFITFNMLCSLVVI